MLFGLNDGEYAAVNRLIAFCPWSVTVTQEGALIAQVANEYASNWRFVATGGLVFAAIAAPGWFDRDATGYDNPGLPPGLIGLLTLILIPVEFLLIVFAMRGFSQKWNVEIEMTREEYDRRHRGGGSGGGEQGGYRPQPQA